MSTPAELEYDLALIRQAMAEPDPVLSAEEQIERRVDGIIRELDELCKMASHTETVDLMQGQKIAFGQMAIRIQLIMGLILAQRPPALRIVR